MINLSKLTAVVLCGGRGSRLGALGKKIPKTLVKVQGKEILWFILKVLERNKINNIILPLGYKGNYIKKFIKKNKFYDLNINCIFTGVNSNIGKRLSKIINKINTENVLLLNGDAIFDLNLKRILANHQKKKTDLTFLSCEITYPYGTIGVVKKKILDFRRNLNYEAVFTHKKKNYYAYNYSGISIIKTDILKKYKKFYTSSANFEMAFFPTIIKKHSSSLIKINNFWHSVDNLKDLDAVNKKSFNINKYKNTYKLKQILLK